MTRKTPAPTKHETGLLTPRPTRQETNTAALALDRELRAAGLSGIRPVFDDSGAAPYVRLNRTDAVDATELARLIRKGMRGTYKVAAQLREAARAHGLDDFPNPSVHNARIHLGDLSIPTADRLACALGAPPQPVLEEIPDWPEGQQLLDRLHSAFKKATGGGFMDMYFHPYCQRCDEDPVVSLGDLTVRTARRFVTALRRSACP
ncbi:hypothetical protein [Streptomyces pinistramenti]|uniref:hypothetical protein n=1 Tax=Streptomyces pinistramenti TaxID=2884812 RepID=UPI001D07F433|nr:hypothetical protein [Streptomyces pinistramenti]MCB5911058.1 hypothetical protein [Streptomyces pinistramenti]